MMLSAMGDLTSALQRLTEHMNNADAAAQSRAANAANAQSVAQRSQVNVPNLPGAVLLGGGQPSANASTPSAVDQTMSASAARQALAAQRQATNAGESTPPGTQVGGGSGGSEPGDITTPSSAEALTWAMLGSHAGPFGRLRMQQYSLQRNIGWAANATSAAQDYLDLQAINDPGVQAGGSPGMFNQAGRAGLGALGNVLGWAQTPKGQWTAMGGLAAYRGTEKAVNALTNLSTVGRSLGYGGTSNIGFAGFRNPFAMISGGQSAATEQGLAMELERQALEGRIPGSGLGSGMTSTQAQEATGTLAAQGFSNQGGVSSLDPFHNMVNGDNMNIAQNLLRPLMNMGLSAQDAAQWTPALRNASASMQQLTDTLTNIPSAAKTAKQTVSDLNAQLEQVGQTLVTQGGTLQQGPELGLAFESATGMQPAIAGQLSQNPIYQGMMMGQYGVLPSGIANLPGGAQTEGMLSMFNLLRNATSGLNRNKYENVPGVGQVKVANGWQLQDSQIAEMMGISQAEVNRLRQQSAHAGQISQTMGVLGSSADQTGLFDPNISNAERLKMWNAEVTNKQSQLGLTGAQLKTINSGKNFEDRFKALQKDLLGNQQSTPQNTVELKVKFTGAAAKVFQQDGTSGLALQSNAGGQSPNNVINTPMGDALSANNGLGRMPMLLH